MGHPEGIPRDYLRAPPLPPPYFRLFRSSDPLIDFGDKDDGYVDEVHPEEATTTLIPPVGHPFRVVRITPRTGPGEMLLNEGTINKIKLNEVGGEAQKLCVCVWGGLFFMASDSHLVGSRRVIM